MTHTYEFPVTRSSDQQACAALESAFASAEIPIETMSIRTIVGIALTREQLGTDDTMVAAVIEATFMQNQQHGSCHASVVRASGNDLKPDLCRVQIQQGAIAKKDPKLVALALALKRELRELDPTTVAQAPSELLRDFSIRKEADLLRLESTLARVAEQFTVQAAAHAKALDERFAAQEKSLHDQLDRRRQEDEAELARRMAILERRQAEIDAKEKRLDDRSSTHARREEIKDIRAKIAAEATFGPVPPHVSQKRLPVLIAALAVATTAATLLIVDYRMHGEPATTFQWVRLSTLSLTCLGSLVFLVAWYRSWFERHARHEYAGRKLKLDFDRAGWISELVMDWQKATNGTRMPDYLLRQLTVNLFTPPDEPGEPTTAPGLAALVAAASRTKLRAPWGDVEIDGKEARRLERAAKASGTRRRREPR